MLIQFYFPRDQYKKTPWLKNVSLNNWENQPFDTSLEVMILYTFFALKYSGFNCELVSEFPKSGIVCYNNKVMKTIPKFNPNLFQINIQVDKTRYIFSDIHVVASSVLTAGLSDAVNKTLTEPSYYIPFWVSKRIIKRSKSRNDKFENVTYMGANSNLAKPFRTDKWVNRLKENGFNFLRTRKKWYDFNNTDVSLFIRKVNRLCGLNKPAQKLYNSWAAGVPVICGNEVEIRIARESQYDFLIANNIDETIEKLKFLRDNIGYRKKIINNGLLRYEKEFSHDVLLRNWRNFFEHFVREEYKKWMKIPKARKFAIYLTKCFSQTSTELEYRIKKYR